MERAVREIVQDLRNRIEMRTWVNPSADAALEAVVRRLDQWKDEERNRREAARA